MFLDFDEVWNCQQIENFEFAVLLIGPILFGTID